MKKIKFLLSLTFLLMTWGSYGYADIVITKTAHPAVDQQQGYIEHSVIRFRVTTGQSQSPTALANANNRPMRRVELIINDKTVTVQNSGDKELYVKGQDKNRRVVVLDDNDYAAIKQGLTNLTTLAKGKQANEIQEALTAALSLLVSWPHSMPVLIWQNEAQIISALDRHTIVAKPNKSKANPNHNQTKCFDESILLRPDAELRLPDIHPFQALPLQDAAPISSEVSTKAAVGASNSDSSVRLCTKMGTAITGTYPLISPTFLPPFTKVVGWDKYTTTVGGNQCLARCGASCVDSVSGVSGLGKNAYTQDCMDHDMCATKHGNTSSYCNFIFSDAANDFFSAPCGHDLILLNTVVSNAPNATSQLTNVSAKLNTFVVFTVKNNGNTRLPHNNIYFDIFVDGKIKKTLQLPRILNSLDSNRYFYQIGTVKTYLPGKHIIKIQIKATTLIQNVTSNDVVSKGFNLL